MCASKSVLLRDLVLGRTGGTKAATKSAATVRKIQQDGVVMEHVPHVAPWGVLHRCLHASQHCHSSQERCRLRRRIASEHEGMSRSASRRTASAKPSVVRTTFGLSSAQPVEAAAHRCKRRQASNPNPEQNGDRIPKTTFGCNVLAGGTVDISDPPHAVEIEAASSVASQ